MGGRTDNYKDCPVVLDMQKAMVPLQSHCKHNCKSQIDYNNMHALLDFDDEELELHHKSHHKSQITIETNRTLQDKDKPTSFVKIKTNA